MYAHVSGVGKAVKIYRSEVIKQDANPEWAPFILPVAEVGSLDAVFEVWCWDWDKDGGHDSIPSLIQNHLIIKSVTRVSYWKSDLHITRMVDWSNYLPPS